MHPYLIPTNQTTVTLDDMRPYVYSRPRSGPDRGPDRGPSVAPRSLFRCVFQHVYGEAEILRTLHFANRETDEKLKIVTYLKDNLGCLKAEKFTKDRTRALMGDLVTNKVVTVETLYALACYYKLHVVVLHENKRVYLEMFPQHEDGLVLACVNGGFVPRSSTDYATRMHKLVAHDKVLHGVSTYTLPELILIAETVGYDIPTTKCKKADVYTGILAHVGDLRW